jgi:hypothetical protein
MATPKKLGKKPAEQTLEKRRSRRDATRQSGMLEARPAKQ